MPKTAEVPNELQMTPEQKEKVHQLSEADLKDIDRNLLENASQQWSKVGRLVLSTMIERNEGISGLPELFYLERISTLVKEGSLEARGGIDMKQGEVRLPEKK
jgi:N-dimethylarginine dimethylaminohydrolase